MLSRYHGGQGLFEEPRSVREPEPPRKEPAPGILSALGKNFNIGGLLKNLKIDWDTGDILLILILLFLYSESDDVEILIMLGLILFMGF